MDLETMSTVDASDCKSPCSKSSLSCDSKASVARRKRMEIRRFKLLLPGSLSLEPPQKRFKGFSIGACEEGSFEEESFEVGFTIPIGFMSEDLQSQVKAEICDDAVCGKSSAVDREKADPFLKPRFKIIPYLTPSPESGGNKDVVCFHGVESNLHVHTSFPQHGLVSIVGRGRAMKEVAVAFPQFFKQPFDCSTSPYRTVSTFHFYAIFDGRSNAKAAIYCKEKLHRILAEELILAMPEKSNQQAFVEWPKVIYSSFLRLNAELGDLSSRGPYLPEDGKLRCCMDTSAVDQEGTRVALAVLCPNEIVVASYGNSKVVLERPGQVIVLSRSHKNETEQANDSENRVIGTDGYQSHMLSGAVEKLTDLDGRYLKPNLIGEPEIASIARSHNDEFLVLASEGLWNALPVGLVCEVTRKCLAGRRLERSACYGDDSEETAADAAAAVLTKLSLARGSKGNISVIVVDLKATSNLLQES